MSRSAYLYCLSQEYRVLQLLGLAQDRLQFPFSLLEASQFLEYDPPAETCLGPKGR